MKKVSMLGFFAFVVFGITGCAVMDARVQMASLEEDTLAKFMSPRPDKSLIYLFRDQSLLGGAVPMTVTLNGIPVGQTAPYTYLMWELPPGRHEIASHAENVSTLTLNTEPGKTYFIWQEVKLGGWEARSLLQQVDEETGRKRVNESKLIKTYPQAIECGQYRTIGTQLSFKETKRDRMLIFYELQATGVPKLKFKTRPLPSQTLHGKLEYYVGDSGSLVGPLYAAVLKTFAKGEPLVIALISEDQTIKLCGAVIPNPGYPQ